MENMTETNVNRNDDTIYSFVDYKLQNDEKNLKLMDSNNFIYNPELGYAFGFVGQQNNLIEHQQAQDCGIASVLNVLLQSGLTEKEIYKRMVNFDDYNKEKLPYNNQTISDIELALLEYTISSSNFYSR